MKLYKVACLCFVLFPLAMTGCGNGGENTVVESAPADLQAEIEATEQKMLSEKGP